MKIATIIPTLNRPNFLEKALLSINKQIMKPDEIYIVDNNDKDNKNFEVYKKLQDCTNINLIYIKNNGSIQSLRNDTVLKTDCEILSFLDDDDLWDRLYLKKSIELLKLKKIKALYTSMEVINEKEEKLSEINLDNDYEIKKLLVFNPGFFHSNLIVFKDIFLMLNGFQSESGASDKDFFIKLKKNKIKFFINPERLVYRCDHNFQWSKNYKKMSYDKFIFLKNNIHKLSFNELYQSIKNIVKLYLKYLKSLY
ncbi:glycosyltransferase family 2 protein [Candidatus Pelagibacter sp. HIMB1506]|uniref:glycosyltransferase family 2 protein n=1 Tax=Candidatus Pelagibacter sp. HIMB1506 TaxID=3413337 RepID=UPI003F86C25F